MEPASALLELAGVSLACRDRETLLKTFAARLGSELHARAVLIWLAAKDQDEGGFSCRARWSEPGERLAPVPETVTEGVLSALSEDGASARRYSSAEIDPEQLVHLEESQRGKVKTALYVSLHGARGISGAVEVLNKKSGEFTQQDATFLEEAGRLAGQAQAGYGRTGCLRHAVRRRRYCRTDTREPGRGPDQRVRAGPGSGRQHTAQEFHPPGRRSAWGRGQPAGRAGLAG